MSSPSADVYFHVLVCLYSISFWKCSSFFRDLAMNALGTSTNAKRLVHHCGKMKGLAWPVELLYKRIRKLVYQMFAFDIITKKILQACSVVIFGAGVC